MDSEDSERWEDSEPKSLEKRAEDSERADSEWREDSEPKSLSKRAELSERAEEERADSERWEDSVPKSLSNRAADSERAELSERADSERLEDSVPNSLSKRAELSERADSEARLEDSEPKSLEKREELSEREDSEREDSERLEDSEDSAPLHWGFWRHLGIRQSTASASAMMGPSVPLWEEELEPRERRALNTDSLLSEREDSEREDSEREDSDLEKLLTMMGVEKPPVEEEKDERCSEEPRGAEEEREEEENDEPEDSANFLRHSGRIFQAGTRQSTGSASATTAGPSRALPAPRSASNTTGAGGEAQPTH